VQQLTVVAFTHKTTSLNDLSRFFLHEENHDERLQKLKIMCGISELLYISTCNRIEFVFTHAGTPDQIFLKGFFKNFRDDWSEDEVLFAVSHAQVFENDRAIRHLMEVASSLDSMVVGEREIITQVRNSYDRCKHAGLTGDSLRLVIKNVITTAKQVYTETRVGENPLSVVSLAFRKLRTLDVPVDARFIIVGAGETNGNLLKYLHKCGYKNFSIFNRTVSKAKTLAGNFTGSGGNATGHSLEELNVFKNGFDVLISCTASPEAIIGNTTYQTLLQNDKRKKILIDLALPADVDDAVVSAFNTQYIGLEELKTEAEKNLRERESEVKEAKRIIDEGIEEFHAQFRTRKVELKMREVPEKIRAIKAKALNDVFAEDIKSLDERSKEVLVNVMNYMEKKCISVPMIMAKDILLSTK
jgi:glutamyl-tRNA reductase